MPKKSGPAGWLPYWPILLGLLSLGGWAYRTIGVHAVEDERRNEKIRVLEHIIVSEFPRWTAAIDWEK